MEVAKVKKKLRDLVGKDVESVFSVVDEFIDPDSSTYNDFLLAKNTYSMLSKEFRRNTIQRTDYSIGLNKVVLNITSIINSISLEDIVKPIDASFIRSHFKEMDSSIHGIHTKYDEEVSTLKVEIKELKKQVNSLVVKLSLLPLERKRIVKVNIKPQIWWKSLSRQWKRYFERLLPLTPTDEEILDVINTLEDIDVHAFDIQDLKPLRNFKNLRTVTVGHSMMFIITLSKLDTLEVVNLAMMSKSYIHKSHIEQIWKNNKGCRIYGLPEFENEEKN